ncbi:hypothetical protein EDE15_3931 [Edaphobacter aggregans]|uniref:Uncharacterized protein n=1 Tax=Edaphobacter aggregans TaxID=570835 RepID=A0A428MN80_9BACT|nr:hypothetical protein [Edaphobacter aggregans]RSL18364.1 hypothetical protein EDE15_3931 [Edaphobacter aggregans]
MSTEEDRRDRPEEASPPDSEQSREDGSKPDRWETGELREQIAASWSALKPPLTYVLVTCSGLLIAFVLFRYRDVLFSPESVRTWIAIFAATGLLTLAGKAIFTFRPVNADPANVRYVIAFNCLTFVIVGNGLLIVACKSWAMPLILANACLLIGGFFGLLFGYPSGVAQTANKPRAATPSSGTPTSSAKPIDASVDTTPHQNQNLLAESASTLGKVLTGFTLAKASQVAEHFSQLCHALAPALSSDEKTNFIMAGVVIAYFLATGFLSGLLLPSYFMAGKFAAQ